MPPPPNKPSTKFSFFGLAPTSPATSVGRTDLDPPLPELKLEADRDVYRTGDLITVTIEIKNTSKLWSLLIEKLGFEMKGIEKLDAQWFSTPKHGPDSKQRRGEYAFMDCPTQTVVSNQIISTGSTKTYVIRTLLPSILPPSYRGATIRYLYYVRSTLSGQYLILENGPSRGESTIEAFPEVESRLPLQIWVTQKNNGLLNEEGHGHGIVPQTTVLLDVYWKEKSADSEWVKLNETFDEVEEGYESSRDEISSVSSYSLLKGDVNKTFGSSLSLQSFAARSSNRGLLYVEGSTSISSNLALPRLSVAVSHDSVDDRSQGIVSPSQPPKHLRAFSADDDSRIPSASGSFESGASEGFVRGRSYNIRLDDQVLLRFSPKNSDSNYYFSDMIGGTLTFFHEEETRRCLELSISLEMTETISRRFVHPSRRRSPSITKIHSDHHEIVADLLQTSFLFSIPMDGPMTFSTDHVSVQWALRFEFLTTPKNVDWTRFEHPLMIEGRDKCEWVLPITVHAPPLGAGAAQNRNDKQSLLEPLWIRT